MKSIKITQAITGTVMALLFLFVSFPSQAAEVNFTKAKMGKSQEEMGRAIKNSAWLRWNKGRVQAETGRFMLDGAKRGAISQEALGSGIAASAHLDMEIMKQQEKLGFAIANIAQMLNEKTASTGMGTMQELLGSFIAGSAVINQDSARAINNEVGAQQAAMGQEIQKRAQINQIMGMMSQAAYASLEGDATQEISGSMITLLRRNKAFEAERNFRLAMTLLENETGRPMTQIFENSRRGGAALSTQFTRGGLGGFAEYGFFSLAAFLYVGWVFSAFVTQLGTPEETEEVTYQYPEAA